MPRWASRITLEIVSVRVERLKDIGHDDAIAEGCKFEVQQFALFGSEGAERKRIKDIHGQIAYRDLWESINGAGSWEANPWVWMVEFRKVQV